MEDVAKIVGDANRFFEQAGDLIKKPLPVMAVEDQGLGKLKRIYELKSDGSNAAGMGEFDSFGDLAKRIFCNDIADLYLRTAILLKAGQCLDIFNNLSEGHLSPGSIDGLIRSGVTHGKINDKMIGSGKGGGYGPGKKC